MDDQMNLKTVLLFVVCLFAANPAKADSIAACTSATESLPNLIGTTCSIGSLIFTFNEGPDVGLVPDPVGFFFTRLIAFTPEVVPLANGAEGIGFQLGPITNLVANDFGIMGFTVQLNPNVSGSVAGITNDITGSISFVSPPEFGDIATGMDICPDDLPFSSGFPVPCVGHGASVSSTNLTSDSRTLFIPPPFAAGNRTGNLDFGFNCQGPEGGLGCQVTESDFLVIVQTPEPSSLLMLFAGMSALVALGVRAKRIGRTERPVNSL
jgi:hypothetical protein